MGWKFINIGICDDCGLPMRLFLKIVPSGMKEHVRKNTIIMNEISIQLQSVLTAIRIEIESEKKEFIKKCGRAQSKIRYNLSDSETIEIMSEVMRMINEANKTYYAYLQLKLRDVDKKASSYLLDDLDYEVVNQVYKLICSINEESTIGNSLNHTLDDELSSLIRRTLSIVTYTPSVTAKGIELDWRDKLRNMPASKKQVYWNKKDHEQAERRDYEKELDAWKAACIPINNRREYYVKSAIEKKEKEIKEKLDTQYAKDKSEKEAALKAIMEEIREKEIKIEHLGFFKIKEKKELKVGIATLSHKIEDINASLSKMKCLYEESLLMVSQKASQLVESVAVTEAEKKYPYPTEPDKPEIIKEEEKQLYAFIDELRIMFIEKDRPLNGKDIYNFFMGKKSHNEIREALSQGVKDNLFIQVYIRHQPYWGLKDEDI